MVKPELKNPIRNLQVKKKHTKISMYAYSHIKISFVRYRTRQVKVYVYHSIDSIKFAYDILYIYNKNLNGIG